ncbi:SWIM zinc finger family protein [Streptomyces sp. Je 1-79]|uniref:SWIM zinc finger family protein n=1 Tax=Streptomyces sp. Je 1-79 TaxID=2943847 RepID=UPI0021A5B975|nr:SWIM zinc finger family protein [Streptomyces sp. Je 1-79]MCT4355106.1 SWIM zinc finger family protein [Streptomyces sp. Je 1-79]
MNRRSGSSPRHDPDRRSGSSPRPGAGRRSAPGRFAGPRHDDLRRTFPALEPREAPDGRFAATWWGNAWVEALEDTALDPARLARGKAYAGRGHVDAITVTPGRVVAYVHGTRPRPYRTEIRLRTLGDDGWERFLDEVAARPDHIAALLDKDVPHALEAVTGLLPAPGDLVPDCSCPDDGFPCKHAAALCYQSARLLDEDPFVLFLMRGRGEQEILADLTHRNAARSAAEKTSSVPPMATVPARAALAPGHALPSLPPPLPAPAQPGRPPSYPPDPHAPDPLALDLLASEAAARAHAFLVTGDDPVAALTPWQDAVRLAAAHPGSGLTASTRALYRDLAYALDRTPTDLARAVAAWRQGGIAGLAVLEEPWDPPAGPFDRARPALLAADFPAFRPWRNHLSTRSLQLRFGRDGLWYGYESDADREDWWPRGTPDADPVGALTDLLGH